MTKTTTNQAKQAAEAARDSYSHDRYTEAGWRQIALRLASEGATPAEIDWVLRSKHMRWAADHANRNHSVTGADFAAYVVATFKGTFPWQTLLNEIRTDLAKHGPKELTGADLAGDCTGEDIAEMIHIVQMLAKGQALNEIGAARITDRAKEVLATIERRAK